MQTSGNRPEGSVVCLAQVEGLGIQVNNDSVGPRVRQFAGLTFMMRASNAGKRSGRWPSCSYCHANPGRWPGLGKSPGLWPRKDRRGMLVTNVENLSYGGVMAPPNSAKFGYHHRFIPWDV